MNIKRFSDFFRNNWTLNPTAADLMSVVLEQDRQRYVMMKRHGLATAGSDSWRYRAQGAGLAWVDLEFLTERRFDRPMYL